MSTQAHEKLAENPPGLIVVIALSFGILLGGGTFLGLAAYTFWSGQTQLERQRAQILASKSFFGMRSRRFGVATTSLGLAWLGIYRLFM